MIKIINVLYMGRVLIPLIVCLNYTTLLFFLGLVGIVWNKHNFIIMLLCIELMFISIGLNFIIFSIYFYSISGQILMLYIITVAAAETSIGLSLLVIAYRLVNKVSYNSLITLRG